MPQFCLCSHKAFQLGIIIAFSVSILSLSSKKSFISFWLAQKSKLALLQTLWCCSPLLMMMMLFKKYMHCLVIFCVYAALYVRTHLFFILLCMYAFNNLTVSISFLFEDCYMIHIFTIIICHSLLILCAWCAAVLYHSFFVLHKARSQQKRAEMKMKREYKEHHHFIRPYVHSRHLIIIVVCGN